MRQLCLCTQLKPNGAMIWKIQALLPQPLWISVADSSQLSSCLDNKGSHFTQICNPLAREVSVHWLVFAGVQRPLPPGRKFPKSHPATEGAPGQLPLFKLLLLSNSASLILLDFFFPKSTDRATSCVHTSISVSWETNLKKYEIPITTTCYQTNWGSGKGKVMCVLKIKLVLFIHPTVRVLWNPTTDTS